MVQGLVIDVGLGTTTAKVWSHFTKHILL